MNEDFLSSSARRMKLSPSNVVAFLFGFILGLQALLLQQQQPQQLQQQQFPARPTTSGGSPPPPPQLQRLEDNGTRGSNHGKGGGGCSSSIMTASTTTTLTTSSSTSSSPRLAGSVVVVEEEDRLDQHRGELVRNSSRPTSKSRSKLRQLLPYSQHRICVALGEVASSTTTTTTTTATTTVTPSTGALWNLALPDILRASQPSSDRKYALHDFMAELLALTAPRLHQSVGRLPTDWAIVRRILTKLHQRLEWVDGVHNNRPPPPIKIVALGGSVLMGRNCPTLAREVDFPVRRNMRQCSWSMRLEHFLNTLAGQHVVEVHLIAFGGTNTAVGTSFFEYNLLPEPARHPDIVINAYSTNDMHVLSVAEAQEKNQTMRTLLHDMIESFVRSVLGECSSSRHRPLLLHLDDYQGNEQRELLAIAELSQVVQTLSSYYGFGTFSYADVVRDLVYRDTHETWFSPPGWYNPAQSEEMQREIHPPMGMHILTMWVVAYNFLHIATTFCSLEVLGVGTDHPNNIEELYNASYLARLAPLRGSWRRTVEGRPRRTGRAKHLPPRLTLSLSLKDISKLWADAGNTCTAETATDGETSLCLLSWLSSTMGEFDSLARNLSTVAKEMSGWTFSSDHDKTGYVPSRPGDVLLFEFDQPLHPTHKIALWFMKSYGAPWTGSRLQVTVSQLLQRSWQTVSTHELFGVHAKNTSEMYTEVVPVDVPAQASLRLRLTFTGSPGSTFKLMGLAVCR